MNITKEFIACDCKDQTCQHFVTCDMLPTEVVRHIGRPLDIDLLVYGCGAGKEESRLKRSFVGVSGKYMRKIFKYLWDSDEVFNLALTNNVRCHPMDQEGQNREPTALEIIACRDHLIKDINALNPKVIVPVGKNALSTFIDVGQTPMSKLRGKVYNISGIQRKIIPTWHPAYLIRQYRDFNPDSNNFYDKQFMSDILLALNCN